ncbi:MAG: hypothetical protein WAL03_14420, partial [Pseudolabrys sp.]
AGSGPQRASPPELQYESLLTPRDLCFVVVMPGFMPGIHAFFSYKSKTWMASEVGLARLPR